MANDDTSLASACSGDKQPGVFKRSASEQTFSHLQQMERNYSKLGNGCSSPKLKENSRVLGTIKVASLNSINLDDSQDKTNDALFAGRRDVSNPSTLKEKRIVSKRGSIRGFKNRVRAGIATFFDQNGYTVSLNTFTVLIVQCLVSFYNSLSLDIRCLSWWYSTPARVRFIV